MFNTLNNYKTVGRPLEPHQNSYSWALRRYKKGTKVTIKAPTARNHEAVYIHFGQRQTRYIETPKRTHSYSNILFSKGFLILNLASKTLWQAISIETLTRT